MKRKRSYLFKPVWRLPKRIFCSEIPQSLLSWLLDQSSLTLRLQQACGGNFSVRVLSQHWSSPGPDEANLLGLRRGERALVRQVHLLCDGQPWVFARTVIPVSTLRGRGRRLSQLGSRPLGEVLFADPSISRGTMQIASIHPGQVLFRRATSLLDVEPETIWGRRSLFYMGRRPLLVNEVFLPNNVCGANK
ncbi:MAG: chorismate lyase [Gammaproteobacteria bacterium]|nr:chorismate lyase [Gammaproteobacteria bacterium]